MKLQFSSSSPIHVQSSSPDGVGFLASIEQTSRVISGATSAPTTSRDLNIQERTDATVDKEGKLRIDRLSNLYDSPIVENLTPSIAAYDSVTNQLTRIADGAVELLISSVSPRCVRRVSSYMLRINGATQTEFLSFRSGSARNHMDSAIRGKIEGKTAGASVWNIFSGNGRNLNNWASDVDLTCIPKSIGTNGVLITPRDMVFANHFGTSNPTFMDNNGATYSRTVIAANRVTDTDYLVATLNSDLPSAISPCKMLPANFRNYITSNITPSMCSLVFTNQDRALLVGAFNFVGNCLPNPDLTSWYYVPRGGDSGSGFFLIINNELSLISTFFGTQGASGVMGDWITQINSAIASNGSPYSITTTDLSSFPTY